MNKKSIFNLASIATAFFLIALTSIKIYLIAFSNPIMGYANNWDFFRQSTCTGIWMQYQDRAKTEGHAHQFINSLVFDGDKPKIHCLRSSGNISAHISALLHEKGDAVDFRTISAIKSAVTAIGIALLIYFFRSTASVCTTALASILIIGDITNILYLNTLYTEYSVILSIFISIIAISNIIASKEYPNRCIWIFSVIAILCLGLSKQQYMPLGIFFAFILAFTASKQWGMRKTGYLLTALAILIPVIFLTMNWQHFKSKAAINNANKTNTFMAAVLPEASDLSAALTTLGLPEHCRQGVGESWYSEKLRDGLLCPEVAKVSRTKLLILFAQQPNTFIKPIQIGLSEILPFMPINLSHSTDPADMEAPKYQFVKQTSLSTNMNHLISTNKRYFDVFVALVFVTAPFLLLLSFRKSLTASTRLLLSMAGHGGILMFYSVFSSVFGDGYSELPKHAVGFMVGVSFVVTAFLCSLSYLIIIIFRPVNKSKTI